MSKDSGKRRSDSLLQKPKENIKIIEGPKSKKLRSIKRYFLILKKNIYIYIHKNIHNTNVNTAKENLTQTPTEKLKSIRPFVQSLPAKHTSLVCLPLGMLTSDAPRWRWVFAGGFLFFWWFWIFVFLVFGFFSLFFLGRAYFTGLVYLFGLLVF